MAYYEIIPEHADQIPDVIVKMRALGGEFSGMVRGLVAEAISEGQRVAEMEAPIGSGRFHEAGRIKDSIRSILSPYAPGGAGGGGTFEGQLFADSAIAPQLQYVMEGTADEGRGLITPARGNVLAIEKDGEGVHFRAWVHGQRPNTRWWTNAREAVDHSLSAGVESFR